MTRMGMTGTGRGLAGLGLELRGWHCVWKSWVRVAYAAAGAGARGAGLSCLTRRDAISAAKPTCIACRRKLVLLVRKVVDEDDINADDIPDDMEAIAMGDKCLMYRSSILEVRPEEEAAVFLRRTCHRCARGGSPLVPALGTAPGRALPMGMLVAVQADTSGSAVPHCAM